MSREACVDEDNLAKYAEEPNAFWKYFKLEDSGMFDRLDKLLDEESLEDWFVWEEAEKTIDKIVKFVNSPNRTKPGLCIIQGRTGSGKTTCIRVLFEKKAERISGKLLYVYIDTNVFSGDSKHLQAEMDSDVYRVLKEKFGDDHFPDGIAGSTEGSANKVRLQQLLEEEYRVVVVWDNIDQCPFAVQMAALRLARHKLHWVKDMKLILPLREYTFSVAERELAEAKFDRFYIKHSSPPIEKVIRKRASLGGRSVEDAIGQVGFKLGRGYQVTVAHGGKLLGAVIKDLTRTGLARTLNRLANYNVDTQLRMVEYAFKSPYLTDKVLLNAFYAFYERHEEDYLVFPIHRFLEAIITGALDTCYSVFSFRDSHVINLFDANVPDEWYNTLNRPHVAEIINGKRGGALVEDLVAEMEALGHPKSCTEDTISTFLGAGLVWSHEGGREYYELGLIRKVFPTATLDYYCRTLMHTLVYLQHMGLVTPLEPKFRNRIDVWAIDETAQTFNQRIDVAKALLRQLATDETREKDIVDALPQQEAREARKWLNQHRFGNMAAKAAKMVLSELKAIQNASQRQGKELDALRLTEKDWGGHIQDFERLIPNSLAS